MLRGEHGHLVRVLVLALVIVNDWFHGLLVILALIAIDGMALDINHAWALAEFSADLEPLLNLIFVKAWRPVVRLHLREAATLRARLRDCAVSILVLLVHQFDLWLQVLIGVRCNFRYLVY